MATARRFGIRTRKASHVRALMAVVGERVAALVDESRRPDDRPDERRGHVFRWIWSSGTRAILPEGRLPVGHLGCRPFGRHDALGDALRTVGLGIGHPDRGSRRHVDPRFSFLHCS